jgi:hypothetical protein
MTGRPLKWSTPVAFQKAVNAYFASCKKENKPVSKAGLAVHLNLTRMGLWKYHERKGYAEIIDFAETRIEEYLVNRVLTGAAKTIGGPIFILKTCHGYHETQKLEHDGELVVKIKKFADGSDAAK